MLKDFVASQLGFLSLTVQLEKILRHLANQNRADNDVVDVVAISVVCVRLYDGE